MSRPSLAELSDLCQKPNHRRVGNWVARRITRPAALPITWLILPAGISAHTVTLIAWGCGIAAAVALGWGTSASWLTAALLLQLWYLLDHVDGQIARYRGTDSLDGVQLDYLMHHTLNLLIPLGAGYGAFVQTAEPLWLLAGLAWGLGQLVNGLLDDTRYKAFIARLKALDGELRVIGGAGDQSSIPLTPAAQSPLKRLIWLARKLGEPHVMMHVLLGVAVAQCLLASDSLGIGRVYVAVMAMISSVLAPARLFRSLHRQDAETDFKAWYRLPEGCDLEATKTGWRVTSREEGKTG
jgi:hypothetical protein